MEIACCECGAIVGEVSEDTFGYIGTSTLCEPCDEAAIEEIVSNW